MKELEVLSRVRAIFDQLPDPKELLIPNGDDGAVFTLGNSKMVAATDMAVEGVHFRTDWSSAHEIGRKITAANLADIFAMGGWPKYLLVSVAFPSAFLNHLEDLAIGIREEAAKVNAKVIGGDISSSNKLIISITALGETDNPITRSGAQLNDLVMISNLTGWSAAGLSALEKGFVDTELSQLAIRQHCAPELDYKKYQQSFNFLNAATDTSDGLILDAANIAHTSEVAMEIDSAALRALPDFEKLKALAELLAASNDEESIEELVMSWVLRGGEDHVLLVTGPKVITGFSVIGKVTKGSGVWLDGSEISTELGGFQHHW